MSRIYGLDRSTSVYGMTDRECNKPDRYLIGGWRCDIKDRTGAVFKWGNLSDGPGGWVWFLPLLVVILIVSFIIWSIVNVPSDAEKETEDIEEKNMMIRERKSASRMAFWTSFICIPIAIIMLSFAIPSLTKWLHNEIGFGTWVVTRPSTVLFLPHIIILKIYRSIMH